ncbi:MAG: LysE family transporter [Flavobacteriales bacterium]|nr:LysE family transporter [Bacteroidota bacterium]MCB9239664.1 LysE family transporter [Flavobacteriales bacterium]
MVVLEGLVVGLAMVVFIGPVFFTLLQTTLERGKSAGLSVALGIFMSDVLVSFLCYSGASLWLTTAEANNWTALVGSILLLGLAIKYLTIQPSMKVKSVSATGLVTSFVKGFLINFVNPFVFVVWIGVTTAMRAQYIHEEDHVLFLVPCLLGILFTDSIKVLSAHKLMRFFTQKHLQWIYRICGIVLVIFAIRMGYSVIQ